MKERLGSSLQHKRAQQCSIHHVARAFIPLLQKGSLKKVVNVYVIPSLRKLFLLSIGHSTTTLGSIAMANIFAQTPCSAYKIPKAMLNMLTVQYSFEYASQGFTIFATSPGVSYYCLFLSDREKVAKFLVVATN